MKKSMGKWEKIKSYNNKKVCHNCKQNDVDDSNDRNGYNDSNDSKDGNDSSNDSNDKELDLKKYHEDGDEINDSTIKNLIP